MSCAGTGRHALICRDEGARLDNVLQNWMFCARVKVDRQDHRSRQSRYELVAAGEWLRCVMAAGLAE